MVALPGRHLDGLPVVHAHVLQEPDIHGVGRGHLRHARSADEQPARGADEQQHERRRHDDERPHPPRLPHVDIRWRVHRWHGVQVGHLVGSGATPCAPAITSGITVVLLTALTGGAGL